MATIKWPTDVPKCFLVNGYIEEQQPTTIRSPVDSGPHKVRRRYTVAYTGVGASIVCDKTELAKFWLFYNTTLQGGTLPFEHDLPTDDKTYDFRFLDVPRVSPITDIHFQVEITLEKIT